MNLSTSRLHSKGNRMPHCTQPLATDPSRFSAANTAVIFLPLSIEPVHWHIVAPCPCRLASFVMMSNEVLSKAPSIFRNAPSVSSPFSTSSSIHVSHMIRCSFAGLPGWQENWYQYMECSPKTLSLKCLCTNFSIVFSMRGSRLIGRYALASV